MKKWFVATIIGCFLLGGCSNKVEEAYQSAMTDGIESVANEEYSKAEAFFETALKEKKDDGKAKKYLAGLDDLQTLIQHQEDGNLEEGMKLATRIADSKDIPKTLKKRASEIGNEFTTLKTNLDENSKLYTEAEKLTKEKKYSESNEKLKAIQDKKLEGVYYTELLANTVALSKTNTTEIEKIAAAEKAADEKKVKEEAEQKAAEEAEKQKQEEERKATEEAAKQKAIEEQQAAAGVIPAQFQGDWADTSGKLPLFGITATHYIDYMDNGKEYKITQATTDGGILTLVWDIDDFISKYGEESVGPGPQPFMFNINVDGTLGDLSGFDLRKLG